MTHQRIGNGCSAMAKGVGCLFSSHLMVSAELQERGKSQRISTVFI
jgi:hypothetical protein